MIKTGSRSNKIDANDSEAWVREVLEPDQLSTAKPTTGLLKLTPKTVVLLWALRVYVVLMIVTIGYQIWKVVHAGS